MDKINQIWNDPVWSKVIATLITLLGTLIYNFVIAKYRGKSFKQVFISFWTFKFELWVYVLFLAISFLLKFEFPQFGFWNYPMSLAVGSLFYYFFSIESGKGIKSQFEKNSESSVLLFNSASSKAHYFICTEETNWQGDKPVGERAKGKFTFDNYIINIERDNTDGRYLIIISNYLGNNKSLIEKDIEKVERIIKFQFQSKIIDGSHTLKFIAKDPITRKWVHRANVEMQISSTSWRDYNSHIRIPGDKDFIITIDDVDVRKAPSSIQIRNLKITEEF